MEEKTSFSKKDIPQLLQNFNQNEMDFFTDIIILREHLKRTNQMEISLPETTFVYISQFHPELKNLNLVVSNLTKD